MAGQQCDNTGCQCANDIPVYAAQIDGLLQLSADFFKSLSFPFQASSGRIPFGHGGLQVLLNAFGSVIRVQQPVADEQRIAFHGFRVLENDVL